MAEDFSAPHALGRLHYPDPRDRGYPLRSLLPAGAPSRGRRYWWQSGWWGDQGAQPHCVAYAWLHWLADGPHTSRTLAGRKAAQPYVRPRDLYCRAQTLDPWPGDCSNPRYEGTSTRAGATVLRELGYVETYWWAWDIATVTRALLELGPVVVGTTWYEGMSNPDADGFLRPRGRVQGGHAYILNGVNTDRRVFRVKNSWGRHWGRNGGAWISFDDFAALLEDNGEAVLAVERRPEE